MISLHRFRQNLLPLFRIMISSGMYVDVSYKGQAYRVSLQDLHTKVKRRYGGRPKTMITIDDVIDEKCSACGHLKLAGVCMNSACSNSAGASSH